MNIFLFAIVAIMFSSLSGAAADDALSTIHSQTLHLLFVKPGTAYQLIQTSYFNNVLFCLLADRTLRGSLRGSMAELTCGGTCPHSMHTYEDFKQLIKTLRSPEQKRIALPQVALLFSFTGKECAMYNVYTLDAASRTVLTSEKPTLVAINIDKESTTLDTSFYDEACITALAAQDRQDIIALLRNEHLNELKCNIALEINCKAFQDRHIESCSPEPHFDVYTEMSRQEKRSIKQSNCEIL